MWRRKPLGKEPQAGFEADVEHRTSAIREIVKVFGDHPAVKHALLQLRNGQKIHAGVNNPLGRYLQEISQYNLLTANDEIRLFEIIEKGINSYDSHSIAEENKQDLIELTIARQTVYLANLKLVIEAAKKMSPFTHMSLMELIQEGNIGVSSAIDRFDYKKGFKFSTYATWWVQQAIQRSIQNKERLIRIPVHMQNRINQVAKTTKELAKKLNRKPTVDEVASAMGDTAENITKVQKYQHTEVGSLNDPLSDNSETEFGDTIVNPSNEIEQTTFRLDDEAYVKMIFDNGLLDAREKYILSLRLNIVVESLKGTSIDIPRGKLSYDVLLLRGKECTLDELGACFGLTRERIRQIENSGLRKIKKAYYPDLVED